MYKRQLVFGTKDDGVSTTIDMITGGLGKTMTIENREYEWAVQIDQDHAVNIRYAKYNGKVISTTDSATTSAAATTTAGIGNSPIYLGLEAVSYTHLDVYKRQVIPMITMSLLQTLWDQHLYLNVLKLEKLGMTLL